MPKGFPFTGGLFLLVNYLIIMYTLISVLFMKIKS